MTHRNHVGMMQLFEKLELAHSRNINAVSCASRSYLDLLNSHFAACLHVACKEHGSKCTLAYLVDVLILSTYCVVLAPCGVTGHAGQVERKRAEIGQLIYSLPYPGRDARGHVERVGGRSTPRASPC